MAATQSLAELAEAALGALARDGVPAGTASKGGGAGWRLAAAGPGGTALEIGLAGPDVPATVPGDLAPPELVAGERPWEPVYRLSVFAPLVVFDLAWRPAEPLRVMSFSRGDWERDLLALAAL